MSAFRLSSSFVSASDKVTATSGRKPVQRAVDTRSPHPNLCPAVTSSECCSSSGRWATDKRRTCLLPWQWSTRVCGMAGLRLPAHRSDIDPAIARTSVGSADSPTPSTSSVTDTSSSPAIRNCMPRQYLGLPVRPPGTARSIGRTAPRCFSQSPLGLGPIACGRQPWPTLSWRFCRKIEASVRHCPEILPLARS